MTWILVVLMALVGFADPAHSLPAAGAPSSYDAVPVLLVPGWADDGPDLGALRERFIEAGWDEESVMALTFEDPVGSNRLHADEIGEAIEELRDRTGAEVVDVAAHSMGGLAVRYYLAEDGVGVRRIAFLGTPQQGTVLAYLAWGDGGDEMEPRSEFLQRLREEPLPEEVEAIVVQTPMDFQVLPAENGVLPGVDHVEVCCPTHRGLRDHEETFQIVRRFFETGRWEAEGGGS